MTVATTKVATKSIIKSIPTCHSESSSDQHYQSKSNLNKMCVDILISTDTRLQIGRKVIRTVKHTDNLGLGLREKPYYRAYLVD